MALTKRCCTLYPTTRTDHVRMAPSRLERPSKATVAVGTPGMLGVVFLKRKGVSMKHVDEHITNRAVRLDGEEFRNCSFQTCTLEIGERRIWCSRTVHSRIASGCLLRQPRRRSRPWPGCMAA